MSFFDRFKKNNNETEEGTDFNAETAVGAEKVVKQIGVEQIRAARQRLEKYRNGKAQLENRIIENEQWWRLRHSHTGGDNDQISNSAWLFNCIISKHADAMDAYPEFNIRPHEENDKQEATILTSIMPTLLDWNDFEDTYSAAWDYKLKNGIACYGVFWDSSKHNGLGDVAISKVDILNLFWEPGITDLQNSKDIFVVTLVDNETLTQQYPQLMGKLSNPAITVKEYAHDDSVDTTNKTAVVDWYYKTVVDGKTVLQYCKFANDEVLYATENETDPIIDEEGNIIGEPLAEKGLYADGEYPFELDRLFCEEGTLDAFGYVDVCKNPQRYIDMINKAIAANTLMASTPRFFIKEDGQINKEEFLNWKNPLVHVGSGITDDDIRQITVSPIGSNILNTVNMRIDEMKETSGNRDVNNGGSVSGVTAASGIAALQEQGGKLSRDMIKASYRVYKRIIQKCIERIRQFYDVPRTFRIVGELGAEQFVSYSNANLAAQSFEMGFGGGEGYRVPEFDIEVTAEKASPYTKLANNELMLQLYQLGILNPQMADQALALLDVMDFTHKDSLMQKVQQNGLMFQKIQILQQQLLSLAQFTDNELGTSYLPTIAQQFGIEEQPMPSGGSESINLDSSNTENTQVKKARQRANDASSPA